MKPREDSARGVLDARLGQGKFRNARYWPAEDLAPLVEHYWIVGWDLRGVGPHLQETLPHPSVHVVFEPDGVWIYGVTTRKFSRRLSGAGRAVGVRFRPGGFRPFLEAPVRSLTDRTIPAAPVFGSETATAAEAIRCLEGETEAAAAVERFLRRCRRVPDANVMLVNQIVEQVTADRTILAVDDIARRFGRSPRTLQRLFREYVGVGPKWVIKRCRLHEAVERLAAGDPMDWSGLARELGYFDQAHFIHDFKSIVGRTPAAYARGQR